MLTGAFAFASRIASVVSAMARSRSPLARQITARLVNGCGSVGSMRIASLMSASAPSSSNVEVPALGESINEALLVRWYKREGDRVAVDEPICELESDKATVDFPAPVGGVLHPVKQAGETVQVGEVIARIDEAATPAVASESPPAR